MGALIAFIVFIAFLAGVKTTMNKKEKHWSNHPKEGWKDRVRIDQSNETKIEARKKAQYRDKLQLLNKSEQIILNRLKEAAPAMHIFSQVSMSQLFHINRYSKDGYRQLGEIGRKSVDFLVCRADTSIVVAIELNGPTHNTAKQQASDEKKKLALEEAGIPLVIWKPESIPSVEDMRKILAPLIVERKKTEAERDKSFQKTP
jgi:hypothetical protein